MNFNTLGARVLLSLCLAATAPLALAQFVPLTGGGAATENFDTLAAAGTGSTLPDGWYLSESGSNANTSYAADDGSANSGNTYSYGATGSAERALGMLRSGSLAPLIGARLRNDSGAVVTTLTVAYTGEQWRLGASGRADSLRFQYSLDATALGDDGATWIPVPALDFASPTTGGSVGKRDGNAAANRRAVSGAIADLALAAGASLWVRWQDTDISGAEDGLAIDEVAFSIETGPPPQTAPVVTSTQPADGAVNVAVASDVRVSFSQAVVTSDAFDLDCDGAPIALEEGGSGSQRVLTPHTLLPAGGSCVFTVRASGVENSAGIALETDYTATFGIADGQAGGYYDSVNTSSPGQLRCTLHRIIRGHTAYPYSGTGTSTWTILELAQAAPGEPDRILDVYRNRLYVRGSDRAGGGGGLKYNREHTWPNSLGFPGATGNLGLPSAPYTDTHMLWLSDAQWNADRGNKPYAFCASNCGERITEANGGVGGGSGSYPGNSNWVNASSFEVWNHRKGEMARAVMYMAIRYEGGTDPVSGQAEPDLELTDDRSKIVTTSDYSRPAYMGLLEDLIDWHQADPPDAEELARMEVVYSFQGNRNPFIDHPEWASRALFESVNPAVCEPVAGPDDRIYADGFDG
ncbi:endonuclease [Dokdonella sp.]|uniref:endonuclease n=1 Tax=Dokdonella sp. TaxID=2291710 RepID=UPI0031CB778E|nr:endonuclease [Dokdonella sp.]